MYVFHLWEGDFFIFAYLFLDLFCKHIPFFNVKKF